MAAETVTISGHNGDGIEAYFARPTSPGPHPGVVVIHHMPGYDRSTKEIVRTFAVYGYAACCPNLFHRYAPGASPPDAAAAARDAGGVPDAQCVDDVRGAADFLRELPSSNGRVGVIGYCSGGRQAYLVACSLDVDAAVDCYGGRVVATAEDLTPARPVAPIDLTALTAVTIPIVDTPTDASAQWGFIYTDPTSKATSHVVKVKQGTEVTWMNTTNIQHTVQSGVPPPGSDTKDFASPGLIAVKTGTFKWTAGAPGTYDYYCSIHPAMRARIIVVP